MKIERPVVSRETLIAAALKVSNNIRGNDIEEDAENIADCYFEHIDGYELAKKLENDCHWDITVDMIDTLNEIHYLVEEEHEKVLKCWVISEQIEPPFENGTEIKQGIIHSVYEYGAAKFKVKANGCTSSGTYSIINFEDAIPL